METAERNPERLFARDVVATYDKLVVRDEDGVVISRPADAVMMRDVLWLIMSPDPDLRELGLYVMSAGSPRMQAELYARGRHAEQARSEFARFVDAELRIHARDNGPWSESGKEELLLRWTVAARARHVEHAVRARLDAEVLEAAELRVGGDTIHAHHDVRPRRHPVFFLAHAVSRRGPRAGHPRQRVHGARLHGGVRGGRRQQEQCDQP